MILPFNFASAATRKILFLLYARFSPKITIFTQMRFLTNVINKNLKGNAYCLFGNFVSIFSIFKLERQNDIFTLDFIDFSNNKK